MELRRMAEGRQEIEGKKTQHGEVERGRWGGGGRTRWKNGKHYHLGRTREKRCDVSLTAIRPSRVHKNAPRELRQRPRNAIPRAESTRRETLIARSRQKRSSNGGGVDRLLLFPVKRSLPNPLVVHSPRPYQILPSCLRRLYAADPKTLRSGDEPKRRATRLV